MKLAEVDFYQSPWLSPTDLQGRAPRLTIEAATLEEVRNAKGGHDKKIALAFKGARKKLLLNKTNAKALAAAYGNDTDLWIGKGVVLQVARASNGKDTIELVTPGQGERAA